MNYAIIIAGGVGKRVGQDIPKQFISVYDTKGVARLNGEKLKQLE